MTLDQILAAHRARLHDRQLRMRADLVKVFETMTSDKAINLVQIADFVVVGCGFASVNRLPRAKATGSKQAIRELDKLGVFANNLQRHIESMHRTALAAIEQQTACKCPHPLKVAHDLSLISFAVHAASKIIAAQPSRASKTWDKSARMRTDTVAVAFQQITGRPPEGKQFLRFLGRVFKIVGERASPEGQLKLMKNRARNGSDTSCNVEPTKPVA